MSYKPHERKIVLYPIEVPADKFCWNWETSSCDFFDNEGGHSHCKLDFYPQLNDINGHVLKPAECRDLTLAPILD